MNGRMRAVRNHACQQGVKKRRLDAFLPCCCSSPSYVVALRRPMRLPTHTVEASGAKQGKLDISHFSRLTKQPGWRLTRNCKRLTQALKAAGYSRSEERRVGKECR